MDLTPHLVVFIVGYLCGSIPFGLILTRLAGMGDIRQIGSGNIGATNVLRTGNKKLAALTLFLDGLKGAVAVIAAGYISPELDSYAAVGALVGHVFPIWLKFRGGKGVATMIGALLALIWPVGLGIIALWLLIAKVTKYSSLAAIISISFAPVMTMVFGFSSFFWFVLAMSALVIWKHKTNIRRLRDGTEPKIGAAKTGVGHDPAPAA